MLMVAYQTGFARRFADQACLFYAGKIADQATPYEIFGNPKK